MKPNQMILAAVLAVSLGACSQSGNDNTTADETETEEKEQAVDRQTASAGDVFEIVPGLTARIIQTGYGRVAEAGDSAEVHYSGWLHDDSAEDKRGAKFDSSVDRGETFIFNLGAGQVIKGWDQGVQGMLIGETRELTIAPEMGYGERGAGNVIPPGSTLVFEVELRGLEGPSDP